LAVQLPRCFCWGLLQVARIALFFQKLAFGEHHSWHLLQLWGCSMFGTASRAVPDRARLGSNVRHSTPGNLATRQTLGRGLAD